MPSFRPFLFAAPLIALSVPGLAQPAAPAAAPAATDAAASAPHAPAQTPQGQRMQAGVERRIKDLYQKLKITPDEQPAWNEFIETMRQNADHADQVYSRVVPGNEQSALDSMRSYAAITQAHAEDAQRLLPKFETLYNGLSPDQRKVADESFNEYRKHMMQRRHDHAATKPADE